MISFNATPPRFQGKIQVTSKALDQTLEKFPALQDQYKQLTAFVISNTPAGTIVYLNAHNQNPTDPALTTFHPKFTRSAEGAKSVDDLIFNIKVKGDPTRTTHGLTGNEISGWIDKLKTHIAKVAQHPNKSNDPVQREFDLPWDQSGGAVKTIVPTKRMRSLAAKHLGSQKRRKKDLPLFAFLLRAGRPDSESNRAATGSPAIQPSADMLTKAARRLQDPKASRWVTSAAASVMSLARWGKQNQTQP